MAGGIFTISLDFELFWGVRDHRTLNNYGSNIRNVHKVVPRMLELFEKYDTHCTWATVGFLFLKSREELNLNLPASFPSYVHAQYDPYSYIKENELDPLYHFAPDLVRMIKNAPGQEIGTHTYSHFYTLEKNTSVTEFKDDLTAAIRVAESQGIRISSIVFPRNQYSTGHIEACRQLGILVFRGNEASGAYRPVSREDERSWRRAIRLFDSYINLTGHHCHALPGKEEIINVPASRFLRPYSPKLAFADSLKFNRIRSSMEYAAKNKLIYQLWWHPHNFGSNMDQNFAFLEKILKTFRRLKNEEQMDSLNLYEIYQRTRQQ